MAAAREVENVANIVLSHLASPRVAQSLKLAGRDPVVRDLVAGFGRKRLV